MGGGDERGDELSRQDGRPDWEGKWEVFGVEACGEERGLDEHSPAFVSFDESLAWGS